MISEEIVHYLGALHRAALKNKDEEIINKKFEELNKNKEDREEIQRSIENARAQPIPKIKISSKKKIITKSKKIKKQLRSKNKIHSKSIRIRQKNKGRKAHSHKKSKKKVIKSHHLKKSILVSKKRKQIKSVKKHLKKVAAVKKVIMKRIAKKIVKDKKLVSKNKGLIHILRKDNSKSILRISGPKHILKKSSPKHFLRKNNSKHFPNSAAPISSTENHIDLLKNQLLKVEQMHDTIKKSGKYSKEQLEMIDKKISELKNKIHNSHK